MKLPTIFAVLLFAVCLPRAEAAPMLIGWGEKVSEVADLPNEFKAAVPASDAKLGYYYNSIRLFFVPVVTWGGKYVIYSDSINKYWELNDEEKKTLEASVGNLTWKGSLFALLGKYVNYLWVVLVVLVIVARIFKKRTA